MPPASLTIPALVVVALTWYGAYTSPTHAQSVSFLSFKSVGFALLWWAAFAWLIAAVVVTS